MRRVPFWGKFAVSSLVAYSMCRKLWNSNIYEPELYQVALKYRNKYDKKYIEELKKNEENK